jgi:SepF-like predicted cell division protein (DUF552 family)
MNIERIKGIFAITSGIFIIIGGFFLMLKYFEDPSIFFTQWPFYRALAIMITGLTGSIYGIQKLLASRYEKRVQPKYSKETARNPQEDVILAESSDPVGEKREGLYEENILSKEFLEYGITYVKLIKLKNMSDVEKINLELNKGNIVLGDITFLLKRDHQELKRVIDQLKRLCRGIGGDIIGVGEVKILVTPTNIRVYRERGH